MEKIRYFFKEFLPEVKVEWNKVTRPGMTEVRNTTIVVVVASVIFAVYLWIADFLIITAYDGLFKLLGL